MPCSARTRRTLSPFGGKVKRNLLGAPKPGDLDLPPKLQRPDRRREEIQLGQLRPRPEALPVVNPERLPVVMRLADRDRQEVVRAVRDPLSFSEVMDADAAGALRAPTEEIHDAAEFGDAAHVALLRRHGASLDERAAVASHCGRRERPP